MERETSKDMTTSRGSRWRLVAGMMTTILFVSDVTVGDDPPDPIGISFPGRVIDKDTENPVAGATIVVTRSTLGESAAPVPHWAGSTRLATDADGRFTIEFPPDQLADSSVEIEITRVAHPDFVTWKADPTPLSDLAMDRKMGGKPYFETIALDRGLEYTGQIVTPEGEAAADFPFEFVSWRRLNQTSRVGRIAAGRTDADGRFRLRLSKTQTLAISLVPDRYLPLKKSWGTNQPDENPTAFVPTDLERITLEAGPILSGRLLDLGRKPIAGQRIVALGRDDDPIRREATTAADGSFAFAPLRPGHYDIHAVGQFYGNGFDPTAASMLPSAPVIQPAKVHFSRQYESPPPIELRELTSVKVEVRFVDSKGRPAPGSIIALSGMIEGQADPGVADKRMGWECQFEPDAEGRVVFPAPRGLIDAVLRTSPPEGLSYKTRLVAEGPLKFWGGGKIGAVDGNRSGIEIVVYQAPSVVATIKTEEGGPVPSDAKLQASFESQGFRYEVSTIEQPDGRFRARGMMPDLEIKFSAWADGYVPKNTEMVSLPESGSIELTLFLRKKPIPPGVGDLAPPFAVSTLDGRIVSLADFRGKYLLLHAWTPFHRQDRELARLQAIRKRYGDDQIALLGLCLTSDAEEATRSLKFWNVAWPQAILREAGLNPIIQDNGDNLRPLRSILIGPDGRIVARDLVGDNIDPMIEAVLGPNSR